MLEGVCAIHKNFAKWANFHGDIMRKIVAAIVVSVILVSCSTTDSGPAVKFKDGEQAVPAGYKSWPKFLMNVQRGDA